MYSEYKSFVRLKYSGFLPVCTLPICFVQRGFCSSTISKILLKIHQVMEVFWKFFEEYESYTLYHEASKVNILQISVIKMERLRIKVLNKYSIQKSYCVILHWTFIMLTKHFKTLTTWIECIKSLNISHNFIEVTLKLKLHFLRTFWNHKCY